MNTLDHIVKKYNLNIGRQYIVEIPGMDSINLAELFSELGFKEGLELGVDRGYYSEILCKNNQKLHLNCVDPWISSAYEKGGYVNEEQVYFDKCYTETINRLKPYNCTIVRKTSADALEDFEDNSLDFVYIDANHDFPNFIFDLHHWIKKVRPGGIVSGHDFTYFSYRRFNHVRRALEAYSRCYRMIPLFVVGDTDQNVRLKRDKYRSWFWVKQ